MADRHLPIADGYTLDGGYAEYTVADQRFCFRIPDSYPDARALPCSARG